MSEEQKPELPPPSSEPAKPGWGMFAAGWAILLLLLTLLFNGFLQEQQNPNRLSVLESQSGALSLRANRNGQYFAEGRINGAEVVFLLDTGATTVAVPERIAAVAGLRIGEPLRIETAAGATTAHHTRIRRLELGNFVFSDLRAVVIPAEDGAVLLGMNALGDLEFTQQDGELILQKPAF